MVFSVFSVGVAAGGKGSDEFGIEGFSDSFFSQSVVHGSDNDRFQPGLKEIIHHLYRIFSPQRFHHLNPHRLQLPFPVLHHVVQENIPEDKMGNPHCFQLFYGFGHGPVIVVHVSPRTETDYFQWNTDAPALCLQQFHRDTVHGRACGFLIDSSEQEEYFIFVRLHDFPQGMCRVFSSAPVEDSFFLLHG